MNGTARTDARLVGAAGVLTLAWSIARRRAPVADPRTVPSWAAAALALAGPVAVLTHALRGRRVTMALPASTTGKLLLAGHVLSSVVLEEQLWRAPVTYPRSRRAQLGLAAASATGFVEMHVRRDGPESAPVHMLNTAGWTASAVVSRSLLWSTLSHAGYNYAALVLRGAPQTRTEVAA
jgi:hypothetical protein